MAESRIILKDSTMREGIDVPGVRFAVEEKRELIRIFGEAGLPEAELVAPGRFVKDIEELRQLAERGLALRTSGLVYGYGEAWPEQIGMTPGLLDRLDILMPLSDRRPPAGIEEKVGCLRRVLDHALKVHGNVGAGFPHATQVERGLVLSLCRAAVQAGARRITLYDTNGSGDPWSVADLVRTVRGETTGELCFHAHNDLGMATANALAAVLAGADCLDVTVNGLGDRAGNASLEQVSLALTIRGYRHGIALDRLQALSKTVAAMSGIPVAKLAPVVGDFVFRHKSPAHLGCPELFEAFPPSLVGAERSLCKD